MPTRVFKVKQEEIHRFHELLLEEKSIETLPTTNPYEVFRVKHRDCLLIGDQIFHNFIRTHEGLKGKTPAEACGIEVKGENKWKTLIQNASL